MDTDGVALMSSILSLGPVVFNGFEVPESITIGGRQRLAVHELPGGGRVVDAIGPEEAPICWSGVCSGQDAAARVRSMERLRRNGDVLALAWEGWRYSVVIQEFSAEVSSPFWIPYRIQLCVVTDSELNGTLDWIDVAIETAAVLDSRSDIDANITAASARLVSDELADIISGAGQLARLVTARALTQIQP